MNISIITEIWGSSLPNIQSRYRLPRSSHFRTAYRCVMRTPHSKPGRKQGSGTLALLAALAVGIRNVVDRKCVCVEAVGLYLKMTRNLLVCVKGKTFCFYVCTYVVTDGGAIRYANRCPRRDEKTSTGI